MFFLDFKWRVDVSWLWKNVTLLYTLAYQKTNNAHTLDGVGVSLVIYGGAKRNTLWIILNPLIIWIHEAILGQLASHHFTFPIKWGFLDPLLENPNQIKEDKQQSAASFMVSYIAKCLIVAGSSNPLMCHWCCSHN
jgi:hypothetical protein